MLHKLMTELAASSANREEIEECSRNLGKYIEKVHMEAGLLEKGARAGGPGQAGESGSVSVDA